MNLQLMLRQVEASLEALEDEVGFRNVAEEWVLDEEIADKSRPAAESARLKAKEEVYSPKFAGTPGPGQYHPNYASVEKKAPTFKLRSGRKHECKKKDTDVVNVQLMIHPEIANVSRFRKVVGPVIAKPSKRRTQIKFQSVDVFYDVNIDQTKPRLQGFAFRPLSKAKKTQNIENEMTSINVDKAYKSIERKVPGYSTWSKPLDRIEKEPDVNEPKYETESCWKSVLPSKGSAVAWIKPQNSTKHLKTEEARECSSFEKTSISVDQEVTPSAAFAPVQKPSKQLIQKRKRDEKEEGRKGPGMYELFPREKLPPRNGSMSRAPRNTTKNEEEATVIYDVDRALELTRTRQVKSTVKMAKMTGRAANLKSKAEIIVQTDLSDSDSDFLASSISSCDDFPMESEGKRTECFENEFGLENVARWVEEKHAIEKIYSSHAADKDKRRKIALERHLHRKYVRQEGWKPLEIRYDVTERSLGRGVVSIETAMKTTKIIEKEKKRIRGKTNLQEQDIWDKLGLSESILESCMATTDSGEAATRKRVKTFKIVPPSQASYQLARKRKEHLMLSSNLGPGVYASQMQREYAKDEILRIGAKIKEAKRKLKQFNAGSTEHDRILEEIESTTNIFNQIRENDEMSRAQGRERREILMKGKQRTIGFEDADFTVHRKDMRPEGYDIPHELTRFGLQGAKGIVSMEKQPTSASLDHSWRDGSVLDLDTTTALKHVEKTSHVFSFSKSGLSRRDKASPASAVCVDLNPNFEFGKFKEMKSLVKMETMKGRNIGQGVRDEDVKHLNLSPSRGIRFLEKQVQAANFGKPPERNDDEFAFMGEGDEGFAFIDGSVVEYDEMKALGKTKLRAPAYVPDFSKASKTTKSRKSTEIADRAFEKEYDVARGLEVTKENKNKTLVNFATQVGRQQFSEPFDKELSREEDRETSHIAQPTRTLVNMKKTSTRWKESKTTEEVVLDIDPTRGSDFLRDKKDLQNAISFEKAQLRWTQKEEVAESFSELHMKDEQRVKGHWDMSQWTGRKDTRVEDETKLELNAAQARDAPSQNERTKGGKFWKSKRSAFTAKTDETVLDLRPSDKALQKSSDKMVMEFSKRSGRKYPKKDPSKALDPPSPAKLDVLKSRTIGGAVALEPDIAKPVVDENRERERLEECYLREENARITRINCHNLRLARAEELVRVRSLSKK